MFIKRQIDAKLDQEILSAVNELESSRDDPEKYAKAVERIAQLDKLKSEGLRAPSWDTVLIVGANVFGVLWLTRFETERILPSKSAFNLMLKPK